MKCFRAAALASRWLPAVCQAVLVTGCAQPSALLYFCSPYSLSPLQWDWNAQLLLRSFAVLSRRTCRLYLRTRPAGQTALVWEPPLRGASWGCSLLPGSPLGSSLRLLAAGRRDVSCVRGTCAGEPARSGSCRFEPSNGLVHQTRGVTSLLVTRGEGSASCGGAEFKLFSAGEVNRSGRKAGHVTSGAVENWLGCRVYLL